MVVWMDGCAEADRGGTPDRTGRACSVSERIILLIRRVWDNGECLLKDGARAVDVFRGRSLLFAATIGAMTTRAEQLGPFCTS